MAQEYITVYQISKQSFDWSFSLLGGIVPLIVGLVIFLGKRQLHWKRPHWLMPIFACCFGLIWLCTAGISVLHEDFQALARYQKGDYQLVEGPVTDFQPMPYEGHQEECFTVQDRRFCYSDYVVAAGFHNTASHGGPIRAGLPVRIAYSGDTILRLDIPKDKIVTPAESAAIVSSNQNLLKQQAANDPVEQRMYIAFLFTAVSITLWWNLQWRKVMQLWLRPPNHVATQYLFRAFFALNFLGSTIELIRQLRLHPLSRDTAAPTIGLTAVFLLVTGSVFIFGLWNVDRNRRKREKR